MIITTNETSSIINNNYYNTDNCLGQEVLQSQAPSKEAIKYSLNISKSKKTAINLNKEIAARVSTSAMRPAALSYHPAAQRAYNPLNQYKHLPNHSGRCSFSCSYSCGNLLSK